MILANSAMSSAALLKVYSPMLPGGTAGASCQRELYYKLALYFAWLCRNLHVRTQTSTYRAAVTHHIRSDNAQALVHEEGNLITPSEGDIWPAMNKEDSSLVLSILRNT